MSIAGFGAGYRPRHFSDLLKLKPSQSPQWLEVLSENFMGIGGTPLTNLLTLRDRFPLCLHGVSMSIAGQDPFDQTYLRDLKDLIRKVDPVYVSDHLCWTSSSGHNSHDLLPVSYTRGALDHVCARIDQMQEVLDRTLLFENPSAYVAFSSDEMSEAEFVAEMCRRTGCGMLLDVNNLYVNHVNLGIDAVAWLNTINPETIGYIHMAGHSIGDGIRIDTHDQVVCPEVWNLYSYVIGKFGNVPSMIEWDGDVPAFSILQEEIEKLRKHAARALDAEDLALASQDLVRTPANDAGSVDWKKVQSTFFSIVTSETSLSSVAIDLTLFKSNTPAAAAVGADVYANAYLQRLVEVFRGTFPVLNKVIGRTHFEHLVQSYLSEHKPAHYSVKYASKELMHFRGLSEVAQICQLDPQLLTDLASLEWLVYDLTDAPGQGGTLDRSVLSTIKPDLWASVVFTFQPAVAALGVNFRVDETLQAFRADENPPPPVADAGTLLIYRAGDGVNWLRMNDLQTALYKGIQEQLSFEKCCHLFQRGSGGSMEDTVFSAVEIVGDWLDEGLIDQVRMNNG